MKEDHRIITFDRAIYDNTLAALDYFADDLYDAGYIEAHDSIVETKKSIIQQWDIKLSIHDTIKAMREK